MRFTRVKSIEIQGFRGFADAAEFDLDADCVILVGANGRGKTSFFDAILWALTGQIPRLSSDDKHVVSLYSDTGEARVALRLRAENGDEALVTRSFDGERKRLRVEIDGDDLRDQEASVRLIRELWPDALLALDSVASFGAAITRSVYLQQDTVSEFIAAEDNHGRFRAVGELVGAGRVTELCSELEKAKRRWSKSTNSRRDEADLARRRIEDLQTQLEKLTPLSDQDKETLATWNDWWTRSHTVGVETESVEIDSQAARQATENALGELRGLKRKEQQRLELARRLLSEIRERAAVELPNSKALEEASQNAEVNLHNVRQELAAAQESAAKKRREQIEKYEASEQLGAMAQLALRHLGDHCPVCKQSYDQENTRRYLEALLADAPAQPSAVEPSAVIIRLAKRIEDLERQSREAANALLSARRVSETHQAWIVDRDSRLQELNIETTPERNVESVLAALLTQLDGRLETLDTLKPTGERIGLALVRSSEVLRRREIDEQLETGREAYERQRTIVSANDQTGELAQKILEACRDASEKVVADQLERIDPLLQRIYSTVDPHPAFRVVQLLTSSYRGKGELKTSIRDVAEEKSSESPEDILSSSQLNALAVSVFLALNLGVPSPPLKLAMLDDPLQSLDDVNLLGLIDLLRRTVQLRQLFISTHDERFGQLLARKLRPVGVDQRVRLIRFTNWSRRGPEVEQRDIVKDVAPLRIAV